jgi:TolB-like protein/DNA-binding winged helix-turn-helix (wHTH) protein/Tfp pilus assembly protein PilF
MAGPLTPLASRLRFAIFELDVRAGELRKGGRRLRLSGQPLRVLEVLARRHGDVVTREELQRELWPADTHVDFEHSLNSAVKRLRAALGESAETPRFIETLPRRGYRFLVPVEMLTGEDHEGAVVPVPPAVHAPAEKARSRRAPHWIVGGVALAGIVALTGWALIPFRSPAVAPGQIRSLAVLPFENYSKEPDQAYFADGMTEALITSLAQIKSLRVISRTSVMSYRGAARPVGKIASELSVDAIIEGSVLRAGENVRITAQLIDAATDRHLWAASYDGRLSDVLTLQNRVAREIASEVRASLSPAEETKLKATAPVDPAVYELYLRGRYFLLKRTEADLERSLQYFETAAAKDPTYALAHVGIAQVWDALASWPGYIAPKEGYPHAKAAALRALALDDSLAEAQTALASVHELYDWDLDAAERAYLRAIELNPNYPLAHHRYGQFLTRTRRPNEGLEASLRARALDPLSIDTNVGLALRLFGVGRVDDALKQMQFAVELDPNYFDSHIHLADLYQRKGRLAEAIATAERGIALSDRSAHALHGLAVLFVREGQLARARPLIEELETHPRQKNPYDIAMLYLQMGETRRATAWFRVACRERTPAMAFLHLAQEGRGFDPIRTNPVFLEALRCVEETAWPVPDGQ